MAKYRKKSVEVVAVQWTGENKAEVSLFLYGVGIFSFGEVWFATLPNKPDLPLMVARKGDYIVKENGEFYPCKPDIFEKTYERVDEDV